MNLEFSTSSRVIFGKGEFARLGELVDSLGQRAVVVTGKASLKKSGRIKELDLQFKPRLIVSKKLSIKGEPTVKAIDELTAGARIFDPQVVVAIGGGSVLDAGKALAALLANEGSAADYLEANGGGKKIDKRPVPFIAVPTTAGTGAEVTKNAVVKIPSAKTKTSIRSPLMQPTIALVDPMLTLTTTPETTAACGLDALTQLIEAFTSRRAGILTDGFAREGLALICSALEHAYHDPQDVVSRESVAMASLLSGMALDNAGLGAVHGLASAIGGMFDAPHGVICANLLPEIVEANIREAKSEQNGSKTLEKYREVARILTGESEGRPSRLVVTLRLLRRSLGVPRLSTFGVTSEHVPEILTRCRTGSMSTNAFYLSDSVLMAVFERVLKEKAEEN